MDLTFVASLPDTILSLIRLTSFLVRPVITATREIFVGRPLSPYSEDATSTKATLATSENSLKPMPNLSSIFAIGLSAIKNAFMIFV